MRRLPQRQPNSMVHRERDSRALMNLALLLVCGLVLAGGFVFAAAQHFTAVQYGYKSEELRRERTRLIEEQRRLLLAREQATTPAQLENAARQIGMQPVQPAQINQTKSSDRTLPHPVTALVNPSASFRR